MTGPQIDSKTSPSAGPSSACLVAEVIGNSSESFEAAISDAVLRLLQQRVDVRGVDVVGWKISGTPVVSEVLKEEDGSPARLWSKLNYRVVLKVAYDGSLV